MRSANNYMKAKGLNEEMQSRVRKYLEHTLDEENFKRYMEEDFIGMLHGDLRKEILVEVYGKTLRECTIFGGNNFTKNFLADLSQCLKEVFLSPEQELMKEGDPRDQCMYFLKKGKVQIYLRDCNKVLKTIGKNNYFGEISFFTGKPRTASAKSLNFSELFRLDRDRFLDIAGHYGADFEHFHFIKDSINLYSKYDTLNIKCFGCDTSGHIIRECPKLQFYFNKIGVIQEYLRELERFRRRFGRRPNRLVCKTQQILAGVAKIQKIGDLIPTNSSSTNLASNSFPGVEDTPSRFLRTGRRLGTLEEQEQSYGFPPLDLLQGLELGRVENYSPYYADNYNYNPFLQMQMFDKVDNFELYFPHNNIQKIVVEFEEKRIQAIIGGDSKNESFSVLKKGLNVLFKYRNIATITAPKSFKPKKREVEEFPSISSNSYYYGGGNNLLSAMETSQDIFSKPPSIGFSSYGMQEDRFKAAGGLPPRSPKSDLSNDLPSMSRKKRFSHIQGGVTGERRSSFFSDVAGLNMSAQTLSVNTGGGVSRKSTAVNRSNPKVVITPVGQQRQENVLEIPSRDGSRHRLSVQSNYSYPLLGVELEPNNISIHDQNRESQAIPEIQEAVELSSLDATIKHPKPHLNPPTLAKVDELRFEGHLSSGRKSLDKRSQRFEFKGQDGEISRMERSDEGTPLFRRARKRSGSLESSLSIIKIKTASFQDDGGTHRTEVKPDLMTLVNTIGAHKLRQALAEYERTSGGFH